MILQRSRNHPPFSNGLEKAVVNTTLRVNSLAILFERYRERCTGT